MGAQMSAEKADEGATVNSNGTIALDSPDKFELVHVRALHRFFVDGSYDFGMDKATFKEFITEALPNASEVATVLWDKFDTHRTKLVNALEVIAGLAIMCVGPILEKIQFIFDLHDFNGQGVLTYDEVVVAIFLSVSSTVLISGKGVLPEESMMERFADEAFVIADVDISAPLDKAGFTVWVIDRLRLEDAEDLTAKVGLREFLKRFEALQRPSMGTLGVVPGVSVSTEFEGSSAATPTGLA
uniref:EF-hand domain-containing protein n=1 Tax=Florenciella parvula TaxID=236787 RepID=A0A7S2AX81_9STRA|mmetsp:Transcript_10563/g.22179  ORF Transcript_10563/g.22179 Transcript_10563/m.22179 type:complete len:242 (+) Transcript_10563:84-809(+)